MMVFKVKSSTEVIASGPILVSLSVVGRAARCGSDLPMTLTLTSEANDETAARATASTAERANILTSSESGYVDALTETVHDLKNDTPPASNSFIELLVH